MEKTKNKIGYLAAILKRYHVWKDFSPELLFLIVHTKISLQKLQWESVFS